MEGKNLTTVSINNCKSLRMYYLVLITIDELVYERIIIYNHKTISECINVFCNYIHSDIYNKFKYSNTHYCVIYRKMFNILLL